MHGEYTQRFVFAQHAMQVSGLCRNLERCTTSREHGCLRLPTLQRAASLSHHVHKTAEI